MREYCAESCRGDAQCDELGECIALLTTCSQLCRLTAELVKQDSPFLPEIARACAEVCQVCGVECHQHPHDHCQRCGRRCQECVEECQRLAALLPTA
jgi:hypothetical protein